MTIHFLRLLPAALFVGLAIGVVVTAAPAPVGTTGTFDDRAAFMPRSNYKPLPGKAVGLLLSNVANKMAHEGRSGTPDALAFSSNGASYRWLYLPVAERPQITDLRVRTGVKGDGVKTYPSLSMASPRTLAPMKIAVPYALVEVEVNDGQGSPAEDAFVATKMTRLDGTKEYPLNVAELMTELPKKYAAWKAKNQDKHDEAMTTARKQAIENRTATGPRQTQELVYATWLTETQRLRVHFRTTITDGEYKDGPGGADRGQKDRAPARPAANFRSGTSFGIEFGLAYEVSAEGRLVQELVLPPQAFKHFVVMPRRPAEPAPRP